MCTDTEETPQDKERRTEQSRFRIPIESETCETDIVQGRKNQTYSSGHCMRQTCLQDAALTSTFSLS